MTACMFHHHVVFAGWLTKLYSLNISIYYISLYIKCKIRFWYFIIIKLKLNNVLKSIKMTSCMHYSYLRTNYKNVRHDYIIHKQICPSYLLFPPWTGLSVGLWWLQQGAAACLPGKPHHAQSSTNNEHHFQNHNRIRPDNMIYNTIRIKEKFCIIYQYNDNGDDTSLHRWRLAGCRAGTSLL